jgi:hypothetical protein
LKTKLCFLLLGISMMFGCRHTALLDPVQGSLSLQTRPPVLAARISGAINLGSVSVVLSDGESGQACWTEVPRDPKPASAAGGPATNVMAAESDMVYGAGFYVAHVLGAKFYARAALTGNRGSVLDLEIYTPVGGGAGIKGVAKDDKGNLYKLVWQ